MPNILKMMRDSEAANVPANTAVIMVGNPASTDYGLLANLTEKQLQQAIDARKSGQNVRFNAGSGDILYAEEVNPIIDNMIETGAPVSRDSFHLIGAKLGIIGPPMGGNSFFDAISNIVGQLGPAALGAATAGFGLNALSGLAGGAAGAGSSAGLTAAGVTPEAAAMGLGESLPTAGGFLGADTAALGAGAAGAGMTNEAISNALMSGQYGGMTGPLTSTEAYNAVIAGGGSAADAAAAAASVGTGIGSGSTSMLSNLGLGGGTAGTVGGTTNALSSVLGGGSNLGNLANTALGLYGQYEAGQSAKDIAAQNAALQKPWLEAGTNALAEIVPGIKPGGEFRKDYTIADYQQDPYNKWLQSQGTQAITRSAAAKGSLGSGNVLAELSKYNQNVAGAGFADQWNREQTGTANKFNRLASVAQLGQQAPANVLAGNAFAASEGAKSKIGMTNTLSNLVNSWGI